MNLISNFDDYQQKAKNLADYPNDNVLPDCASVMFGEAVKVANIIQSFQGKDADDYARTEMATRLGSILCQVSVLADELGFSLEYIAHMNLEKLTEVRRNTQLQSSTDD
ncbi:MAG: hypothetical protein F6K54_32650 [Okeania sp. SIO3B5]|uniref:hypothetical protein n=1 Tax=Okeania sp. SIO3B5 TaxID=2607811 RepID=UPI0013FF67D6|nr:hypothetical protein [Okeania sp. SIO3B5]NEO57412.1 hypothetical protein [Okeania sp. SIO3B5]